MEKALFNTPKILIVDDEPRMCQSLMELLADKNYELNTANSAKEAIEYLNKNYFDLILLDLCLPDMNGSHVMDHISQQGLGALIIILTGNASEESAIKALRRGAYDYLKKPFAPEKLLTTVKNALNQQKVIKDGEFAKEALRASEEKYRSMMEAMDDATYICSFDFRLESFDFRLEYMNPAMIKSIGRDGTGELCHKVIHGLIEKCPGCIHEKVMKGEHVNTEVVSPKDDKIYNVTNSPLFHEDGSISKMTIYRDITGRVRAEKALQKQTHELEQRIKELNCLYSISKIWERPSFSFEEIIQEVVDLLPASWQYPEITCAQVTIDGVEFGTKNFIATQWKLACDIIVYGERVGALEVYYLEEKPASDEGPFLNEERSLINAISEQLGRITESERAEGALQESEKKFRHLFESNSAIMYLVDPESLAIVDANYTAEKFFGFSRTELVTKKLPDISAMAEDEIRKEIRNAREKNRDFLVFKHKLANGEMRDVEIRSTLIKMKEDKVLNFIIAHDIDDRLRAEEDKKKLEAQLLQAHKFEAIGTLAGGIAHDFNNILWIINGNVELAVAEISTESPARHNLESIEEACRRATDLVSQILSFIPKAEQKRHPLKIGSMVEESLRLLRSSIPATIEIRKTVSAKSDFILADLTQTNQVLMNLYTNATHAMREKGGILEVSLVNIVIEDKEAHLNHDLDTGEYVVLSVRDTGHGIKTEDIHRIFDPYFTTKGVGEGTGMGLAAVYGIIRSYGGTISVDSQPGRGTVFYVFLPVFEKREDELEVETFEILPRGNERILYVDDEEAVLDMVKEMLLRWGYEVEVFQSPVNAIKSFEAQPEKYDLIITDQSMPYITGENLAIELMNIRPDVPIILNTGYSELVSEEKVKSIGIKAFLMKPIVKGVFAETIRKVLDDAKGPIQDQLS